MSNLNSHVRDYLKEFLKTKDPKFAVMVEGPWGVGKTHLIKQIIKEQTVNIPLYVSLYGVSSQNEFNRAIVKAATPDLITKSDKYTKTLTGFLSSLKVAGFSVDFNKMDFSDYLLSKLPETLVFDDLERSTLRPVEILGLINGFVEHEGKKIIILANEDQYWKESNDKKQKEKTVGRTLKIKAEIDIAFEEIISEFNDKFKEFIGSERELIINIFNKSETNNLRILSQTLWEFNRLFQVIEDNLLNNKEGMRSLLELFIILTIEYKANGLTIEDFRLRGQFNIGDKPEFKKLNSISEKYNNPEIIRGQFSTVLPSLLAEKFICEGEISANFVNESLQQTPNFHVPEKETEWQTVWWASERSEKDVQQAVKKMEQKFDEHGYTDPGIILHVFTCLYDLKEMGYTSSTKEQIFSKCSGYIKSLKGRSLLIGYDVEAV